MGDKKPTIIPAVSVAAIDRNRILLVKRGRPPAAGLWALPGGRVEAGESHLDAARRELLEETGLVAEILSEHGGIDLPAAEDGNERVFRLVIYVASGIAGGDPVAGDDAADARWLALHELDNLEVTASTLDVARTLLGD